MIAAPATKRAAPRDGRPLPSLRPLRDRRLRGAAPQLSSGSWTRDGPSQRWRRERFPIRSAKRGGGVRPSPPPRARWRSFQPGPHLASQGEGPAFRCPSLGRGGRPSFNARLRLYTTHAGIGRFIAVVASGGFAAPQTRAPGKAVGQPHLPAAAARPEQLRYKAAGAPLPLPAPLHPTARSFCPLRAAGEEPSWVPQLLLLQGKPGGSVGA